MNIAIVEDEPLARRQLEGHVRSYMERHGIPLTLSLFDGGEAFLEGYRGGWDVVFMDVMMPSLDGMETARRLRRMDQDVPLIFVTSLAQYAIHGYEVDAMDFMLKPVSAGETAQKLDKVRRIASRYATVAVPLEKDGAVQLVNVRSISYIEVYNHSLVFHTGTGDFSMHGQLKDIEGDTRYASFLRCNSCYLVNWRHITRIYPDAVEVGGQKLAVSRRRKKDFMQALAACAGGGAL